jgi:hypothetical protein
MMFDSEDYFGNDVISPDNTESDGDQLQDLPTADDCMFVPPQFINRAMNLALPWMCSCRDYPGYLAP